MSSAKIKDDCIFFLEMKYWLVVSTHLKNISQIGNLPQIGVKINNVSVKASLKDITETRQPSVKCRKLYAMPKVGRGQWLVWRRVISASWWVQPISRILVKFASFSQVGLKMKKV